MSVYGRRSGGGPAGELWTVGPSDVQDFDITGLNGDGDGGYQLDVYLLLPNSVAPTITLQPNQLNTNQITLISAAAGGGAWTMSQLNSLPIASIGTAASGTPFVKVTIKLDALARAIGARAFKVDGTDFSGTATRSCISRGNWTDTVTAINNLRFHSDVAASIKAGSYAVLQRSLVAT